MLLNFISNAIKYNTEGGDVFIDATLPTPDRVRIGVRDTGIGISPDRIENIFDPFDRLGAENSDVEGTGIGLTITKRLVEQMGGQIGVESEAGTGTTFWVEFPVAAQREYSDGEIGQFDFVELSGIKGKVLYVEDNLTNLELVRKIMSRQHGVDLIDSTTAEEGLARAQEDNPDVILMDINLP